MGAINGAGRRSARWPVAVILLAILLAAFSLRIYDVDWADGQLPHPDERSTVAFYAPGIRWPDPGISPLNKRQSPLNPLWDIGRQERRSYTYGHFPLYLLVLAADGLHALAPVAEGLGAPEAWVESLRTANGVPGFALVGRALMAVADTLTVLFVFLLADGIYGRRPGRRWVGLLAAAFSAFTVLQIQLSHFFAVDPISTTFTAMALYGALRMVQAFEPGSAGGGAAGWAVLAGVGAGLAVASKFSALPILAAPVVAAFLIWWPDWRARRQDTAGAGISSRNGTEARPYARDTRPAWQTALLLAFLAVAVAVAVFAVTSPFAILDWANFKQAVLVEQGAMVQGTADLPFTRQYRGTPPYLYHVDQQVRWGIGWPLGLLAFMSLGWALLKLLLGRAQDGELIILSWIIPYFGLTGLFLAKFMRYMVPVVPLLMVFAAGLVAAIWYGELFRGRAREVVEVPSQPGQHRARRAVGGGIAAIALAGAVLWSLAYVNGVYADTHPWIKASRWIYANIPDGATIAWEQWDDSLPYDLPEPGSSRGRYHFIDWGPFEEDNAEKFQRLKDTLRQADVLVLASNRIYGAVDNLPARYPLTNRYYQLLFAGELGYELAHREANHPRLLGIEIDDEGADESFTLYDHPQVHVFRKERDLSDAEWDALLGGSWEGARAWDVGEPLLISRIFGLLSGDRAGEEDPAEPGPGEGKSLLLAEPLSELPVLDDFRWNPLASQSAPLAVLAWWLAISLVGLAAWPITFALFAHLRDRGYLFSRSVGWLLVGYLVWITASLGIGRNALPFIVAAVVLVGLASLLAWRRQRAAMAAFVREQWRLILLGEGLFAAAYLLFVGIRLLNPDLWQPWNGGEKFMEFAFLNAILRSASFPPLDPYFAGGTINYYYYGHYLVNLLIKLTGIWSSVAFNLAIPTLFALTVANVFSLAYNLVERPGPARWNRGWAQGVGVGLLAVLFVALLGNVDGGAQVLRGLGEQAETAFTSNLPGLQAVVRAADGLWAVLTTEATLPAYRYWDPSRVIPFTINEFPYWSFLFADLHPHLIGIPFTVLFLGLALNLLRIPGQSRADSRPALGLSLLALSLTLGALAVINTWDLPTYFGLAVLVWLVRQWRLGHLSAEPGRALLGTVAFAAGLGLLSVGLYFPFFRSYAPLAGQGIGLVPDKTPLAPWLGIWGLLFLLAATLVLVELRQLPMGQATGDPALLRWLRVGLNRLPQTGELVQRSDASPNLSTLTAGALVGLALLLALPVVLALLGWAVPAVLVLPLAGAALLLWRRRATTEAAFLMVLVFSGLLVLMGVEFLYLKDHLQGGDWRRMNTLFKFYIQAWVMLGIAAAVALPRIWRFARQTWHAPWRVAWLAGFATLLALSLVFPLAGTPARVDDRFPRDNGRPPIGTLDGMAYMVPGSYTWHPDAGRAGDSRIVLRHDYDALRWLQDNVSGTPVVAEALVGYYREGGLRAATFTGFPTLLGFHQEGEQRYGWQTGERRARGEEFWRTADPARAQALIEEMGIDYVYVGELERIVYPPEGLEKLDRLVAEGVLAMAYRNDGVTIYRVL